MFKFNIYGELIKGADPFELESNFQTVFFTQIVFTFAKIKLLLTWFLFWNWKWFLKDNLIFFFSFNNEDPPETMVSLSDKSSLVKIIMVQKMCLLHSLFILCCYHVCLKNKSQCVQFYKKEKKIFICLLDVCVTIYHMQTTLFLRTHQWSKCDHWTHLWIFPVSLRQSNLFS